MKIVRIKADDDIVYGVADAEGVLVYKGTPFFVWEPTEIVVPWSKATLLAPVLPTKVVCVGKNYEDHADEMGGKVPEEPLIFLKPSTSVIGPDTNVVYPRQSQEVHHEAELAVVIGRDKGDDVVARREVRRLEVDLAAGTRRRAAAWRARAADEPGERGAWEGAVVGVFTEAVERDDVAREVRRAERRSIRRGHRRLRV